MGDHVSTLKARFRRLSSTGSSISESMKIALLLSSLSNLPEYRPVIASVNSLQTEIAKWNHVFTIFIKKYRRHSHEDRSCTMVHEFEVPTLASAVNRTNDREPSRRRQSIQCYRSNKYGPVMRECREKQSQDGQNNGTGLRKANWTRHEDKKNANDHACVSSVDKKNTKLCKSFNIRNFRRRKSAHQRDITVHSRAPAHVINNINLYRS